MELLQMQIKVNNKGSFTDPFSCSSAHYLDQNLCIVEKDFSKLTDEEYHSVMSLTLSDSGMRGKVRHYNEYSHFFSYFKTLLYYKNKKLVAWALLFSEKHSDPQAYFFVAENWRRRGIGTSLVQYIKENYPLSCICPWDETSSYFFNSSKVEKLPVYFIYKRRFAEFQAK